MTSSSFHDLDVLAIPALTADVLDDDCDKGKAVALLTAFHPAAGASFAAALDAGIDSWAVSFFAAVAAALLADADRFDSPHRKD
jgi:hypothetical protein